MYKYSVLSMFIFNLLQAKVIRCCSYSEIKMLTSIFTVTFLAILVSNVLATPLARDHEDDNRKNGGYGRHDCLSQEEGDDILSTWIDFFVDPVDADVAAEYLTPDFHLYSESTNSVTPGRADTVSASFHSIQFLRQLSNQLPT